MSLLLCLAQSWTSRGFHGKKYPDPFLEQSEFPAVLGSELDQQPGFSRKILRRISFWRGVGRRWSQRGTSQTWTLRWHPSCLLVTFLTPSCASALEWKAQWLAYLLFEDETYWTCSWTNSWPRSCRGSSTCPATLSRHSSCTQR